MSSILRKLLLQGVNGPEELNGIDGRLVQASDGESFEAHSSATAKHVPAATQSDQFLISQSGAAPKWAGKEVILTDAELTGTPTAPTAAPGTATEQVATTAFVQAMAEAVRQTLGQEMANGIRMKGDLGIDGGAIEALPTAGYKVGDAYYVITAGTYAGHICEVGDMIVCKNDVADDTPKDTDWFVIQKNLINALTGPSASIDGNLVAFSGTNGSATKDSGLSMSGVSDAVDKKHEHANASTLAKFGADENGNATYDGKPIGGIRVVSSLEEATAAGAPQGTLFFVVETAA